MTNLVFDFDGVLYDSFPGIKAAFELAAINIYNKPVRLGFEHIGPPIGKMHDFFFEGKKEAFTAAFRDLYDNRFCEVGEIYPGVEPFFKALQKDRYRRIILTNKPAIPLGRILKTHNLLIDFDLISCIDDPVFISKDKGERLALIKKSFSSDDKYIYLGDTMEDYNAALKNNCTFIFAAYGYGLVDKDNLTSISTFSGLLDHIG